MRLVLPPKVGLDLYHIVLSETANESRQNFDVSEFDSNPEFLQRHAHLVKEMEEVMRDFTIWVFPDNWTKNALIQKEPSLLKHPILVGDIEKLDSKLKDIASEQTLLDYNPKLFKIIDNILTKKRGKEIFYHMVCYETSIQRSQVVYWNIKGYQRKGMSEEFYDNFANWKLYFDRASVIKASTYINLYSREDAVDCRTRFKENFIDNFVEGESIFLASW